MKCSLFIPEIALDCYKKKKRCTVPVTLAWKYCSQCTDLTLSYILAMFLVTWNKLRGKSRLGDMRDNIEERGLYLHNGEIFCSLENVLEPSPSLSARSEY